MMAQRASEPRSLVPGAYRKARAIRARRRLASVRMSSDQSSSIVFNSVSICSISSKNALAVDAERRRDWKFFTISAR